VLPGEAKAPTRLDRLPNDLPKVKKWLDRVARDGEVRACYEASGAGYTRGTCCTVRCGSGAMRVR
jgi:hypothetical protein